MFSLTNLKNKLTKTNNDFLLNEKHFLDKELLLKGYAYPLVCRNGFATAIISL